MLSNLKINLASEESGRGKLGKVCTNTEENLSRLIEEKKFNQILNGISKRILPKSASNMKCFVKYKMR